MSETKRKRPRETQNERDPERESVTSWTKIEKVDLCRVRWRNLERSDLLIIIMDYRL